MIKPCFTPTTTNNPLSRTQRPGLEPTTGPHTTTPNTQFNLHGENKDEQKELNEKINGKGYIMDPASV